MLRARKDLRVQGDPSSHPVWRSPEVALQAPSGWCASPGRPARRIHVLHISTGEEMDYLADHKDVATVEVTPHHLTLDGAEAYARLGTLRADEPAGARRGASPTASGGAWSRASPTSSARTTRRTSWRRRPSPIRIRPRA